MKKGRVYWITGLSGAGKTTIGDLLYERLSEEKENLIRLDGDNLRTIFKCSDYSSRGRIDVGFQYSALCKLLSDQGIDVVISTICMYDQIRDWNRTNIIDYFEIYLKVGIEELIRRDQKGLYTGALNGQIKDVMGINMDFEEPKHADIVIVNDGRQSPEEVCKNIIDQIRRDW